MNTSVPFTLYSSMSTYRDSNKSFRLEEDHLKTTTIYNFNVDHSNPQDRKLIYEFGKEFKFDSKPKKRPSKRDKSMIKLLNSPAIMASGISNIIFLSSDQNELCDRLKLLLQEKQAGKNSDEIDEEISAIVGKY